MSERDAIRSYVNHLYHLAHLLNDGTSANARFRVAQARMELARLRRGLGKRSGEAVEMLPLVIPYLRDDANSWERESFFVVGSLFAVHPTPYGERQTMGVVCRQLGYHESAERRFLALLRCTPERLSYHLRQMVQQAEDRGVPINYYRLLHDLVWWNHPRGFVQRRWASDYWRDRSENAA